MTLGLRALALALEATPMTVRNLIRQGAIKPAGTDRRGLPLYDVEAARRIWDATAVERALRSNHAGLPADQRGGRPRIDGKRPAPDSAIALDPRDPYPVERKAKTDLALLKLQEKQRLGDVAAGKLIAKEDVEREMADLAAVVMNGLKALPARVAGKICEYQQRARDPITAAGRDQRDHHRDPQGLRCRLMRMMSPWRMSSKYNPAC